MANNLCAGGRLTEIEKNIDNSLYSNAVFQHTPKVYFLYKGYNNRIFIYITLFATFRHFSAYINALRYFESKGKLL